jgi:hypothetical protein
MFIVLVTVFVLGGGTAHALDWLKIPRYRDGARRERRAGAATLEHHAASAERLSAAAAGSAAGAAADEIVDVDLAIDVGGGTAVSGGAPSGGRIDVEAEAEAGVARRPPHRQLGGRSLSGDIRETALGRLLWAADRLLQDWLTVAPASGSRARCVRARAREREHLVGRLFIACSSSQLVWCRSMLPPRRARECERP